MTPRTELGLNGVGIQRRQPGSPVVRARLQWSHAPQRTTIPPALPSSRRPESTEVVFSRSTGMIDVEMARIPAGRVLRGDLRGTDRREIVVDAFEIGVYPVTEEQVAEILGIPARFPRRPAVDVSWFRAVRFCNSLSEWEGLDPVYQFDGEDVHGDPEADGFRLPTEDEWEYACRAGATGSVYGPLAEVAWTADDGCHAPAEVGGRLPNLHGLFDMLGNVSEWCWDVLDADGNDARVFRGGSWADARSSVRASTRRGGRPRQTFDDVGLRVARDAR